jgi:hypothetical protein
MGVGVQAMGGASIAWAGSQPARIGLVHTVSKIASAAKHVKPSLGGRPIHLDIVARGGSRHESIIWLKRPD